MTNKAKSNQQSKTDRSYSVLVVEDDMVLNKLICSQLTNKGFNIKSAFNGIECINSLRSKEFKLLLIDYKLTDLSIEEIFKTLREVNCTIPFVVMTGYGDENIAVSMMKLGARDYIVKDSQFITRLPEVIKRVIQEVESEHRLISLRNSLLENEERLRLFTEHTKDIIIIVDRIGSIQWSNAAWKRIHGDKYTSLPALKNIVYPEDIDKITQAWNRLLLYDSPINNLTCRIKDPQDQDPHNQGPQDQGPQDRYNVYESTVFPLTINEEKIFYIISRDITENIETEKKKKWVEEQVQYAKKTEILSKVTSSITEDFSTILTGIGGYANLLIDSIKEKSLSKYARKIYELTMKGGEINSKLVMFAHPKNYNIELVSMHSVIHSVLENLKNTKTGNVSIETKLNTKPDNVNADRTLMEMAVRNLVINAYEAIPEAGKIIIQTELKHIDTKSDLLFNNKKKNTSFIKISIKDTGIGISTYNQEKIFEPFFTTKKAGYCNGLGLSIVYSYIKQLNGSISLQSESGHGSEFIIQLPLADESKNSQLYGNDLHEDMKCNSVLVIDDEEFTRNSTSIMLNRLGCSTNCCEDGEKGYTYFLNNHLKIDLIILDLLMPNMNGSECFHKLREVDSTIPIIISSAYSEEKIVPELYTYKSVYFLKKPFTIKKLSSVIAEAFRGTLKK